MDRIIVITGGTKGIGHATAKKFVQEKDKVVVLGRNEQKDNLEELQAVGEAMFIQADVSKDEDCKKVMDVVMEKYGRVDVLCNVAGVTGKRLSFLDADVEDIRNTLDINLIGMIRISQYAAREMKNAGKGVIINVGSICGFMANVESVGYHVSKGGVKMLTQAMARELSPYGIRVVSVAPGWVKTEMMLAELEGVGAPFHMKKRVILPEEIAGAMFLLSLPEASAINGTTVMTDDGYTSFKGADL